MTIQAELSGAQSEQPALTDLATRSAERTLPKGRYLSAPWLAAEFRTLWPATWQWACLEQDVAAPGSYATYEIGDQSYLITRAADGVIRAFHNVCLHRGNRLRSGTGTARELACPYHRWTWDLSGQIKQIPDREKFGDLDDTCLSLRAVAVDSWQGFVFINPASNPEPLADYLAPAAGRLDPYHFGEHTCTRSMTLPIPANWKTVVDGFLEVYHLQGLHPQLLRFLDDVNTTYEVWGRHSAMYMPMGLPSPRLGQADDALVLKELGMERSGHHGKMLRRSPWLQERDGKLTMTGGRTVRQALIEVGRAEAAQGHVDYSGLTDDQLVDDHHYFLFPNVIMNIDAGHFIASRIRPHPTDPDWSYFDLHVFDWLSDAERAARPRRKHVDLPPGTDVGRVPDQDFSALPSVQLGMHSAGFEQVRLSDLECRVLAFHECIDGYVLGS